MLKGKKIYLRLLEKRDIGILYKICNEDKVRKYNTIFNPNDKGIKSDSKDNNLRKALSIINEKNVLVGFITYKRSNYNARTYIIGITIGSRFWNRGYGQDAIQVLKKYLFEELEAVRIELEVIKLNLLAIHCYKKCGFVEEKIIKDKCYIDGKYVDTIVMRILKDEDNNFSQ